MAKSKLNSDQIARLKERQLSSNSRGVWKRRLCFLIICIGVTMFLVALLDFYDDSNRNPRILESRTNTYFDENFSQATQNVNVFSERTLVQVHSVWMLLSTGLLFFALLWTYKRFTLPWMLSAVLLCGFMGLIPFLVMKRRSYYAHINLGSSVALSKDQMNLIHDKLEPKEALQYQPEAMRKELGWSAGDGIPFEVVGYETGVHEMDFRLKFRGSVSPHLRATYTEYFIGYANRIISRELANQGVTVNPPPTPDLGGKWHTWSSHWNEKQLSKGVEED